MSHSEEWVSLNLSDDPIWERTFFVHPLVIVGTLEADGQVDFAPKHMVSPIGFGNWFCCVCTPRHRTYQNILREHCFTVSYPSPEQVLMFSLAASPRDHSDEKPNLAGVPSHPAGVVKGAVVDECPLYLECELDRMIDGFDEYSLIIAQIVAAHAKPEVLREIDRDDEDLIEEQRLLAYVSPGRFASIEHTHGFPFPKGFKR